MEIAVIREDISENQYNYSPWIFYRERLAQQNINILVFQGDDEEVFTKKYDAMLLHIWQAWRNKKRFNNFKIMPIMEKFSIYRAEFPDTIQIILNHTDMSRRPYSIPFWRPGDPILYRTPAYDRSVLYPFEKNKIWAYEKVWGSNCFEKKNNPKYPAGFIGQPTGPAGYRISVAEETAKVGIAKCEAPHLYTQEQYNDIMSDCKIIVCPRGWGEQSKRHWDAWLSGKPVLTDRECDSVEMIPGTRLRENVHYLVFDDPREIPEIVNNWTRKSKMDALNEISENGKRAAMSYDALGKITEFFRRVKNKQNMI